QRSRYGARAGRAAAAAGCTRLGAASPATVMQMVASGYGVSLVPEVAIDVEVRDERVKLLRFAPPEPGRTVGLGWRRTSPRKVDFIALGQLLVEALGAAGRQQTPPAAHTAPTAARLRHPSSLLNA